MKQKRKAISPIIATLILIVITVIAGVFLYSFVSGYMSTLSPTASSPPNIQFVSASYSSNTFTYVIYNEGSTAVTFNSWELVGQNTGSTITSANNVSITGGSTSNFPFNLAPGQTATITITLTSHPTTPDNYVLKLVTSSGYTVQSPAVYAS
jgi:flagellin-like protein